MKKSLLVLTALLLAAAPSFATTPIPPVKADFQFFGKMPKGQYLGEVVGVAHNSKGHIFAYTRDNTSGELYRTIAAQLVEFDANGKYVQAVKGVYGMGFAHQVRVDRFDNVWLVDKGTDNVIRFSPDLSQVTLVLGRKRESANPGTGPWPVINPPAPPAVDAFREVTDVAWDSQDNIFVSDGYVNSRVVKYDRDGNYIMSFGKPGHGGPGDLATVHTIAIDNQDNVYVGDRANNRIQVFDTNGNFKRFITTPNDVELPADNHPIHPVPDTTRATAPNKTGWPGSPWVMCVSKPNKAGEQFLFSADSYPGRIYKMKLDGTVLAAVGGSGHTLGRFGDIHGMTCLDENTVIVGDELNWRMTKVHLHD